MNITVLGSGGWGTALAVLLAEKGEQVSLWSHRPQQAAVLRETGENPRLPGVKLPPDLRCMDTMESLRESELVVFAAPSFAVRETARQAAALLRDGTVLVSAAKGIEKGTSLRMTEIIGEETGGRCPTAALSGPSHAEEVGRGAPTGCVAAARDLETARFVQEAFMTPRFRVYTNEDIVGVELGAALKNVLALCCGVSDGMGLARLGVALGGRKETFAGLSGMGDLIVTCTSMHSRNRRCGILIGEGKNAQEAMEQVGAVVEGYFAALSACQLSEKMGVEMPICQCAYDVLYRGESAGYALENLMTRHRRHEVDESWI